MSTTEGEPEKTKAFVGNHDGKPDVYVPGDVCEALGIEIGSTVEIIVRDDHAELRPVKEDGDE
jgi:bifunctional DNA-binding transcriptional regulator/antitoxin component of YhaV-PrlF toxin-antitoxin module